MQKLLTAVAFAALAAAALSGQARAEAPCAWAGNHWDCGARHVYPRYYYQYPAGVIAQPAVPDGAGHAGHDYYGPRPN